MKTRTPQPLVIAKRLIDDHGEIDPVQLVAMKSQTANAVAYWLTTLVGAAYAHNFLREYDSARKDR